MQISNTDDPMRKREEFAVSLRKKKKQTIIANKRMKMMMARPNPGPSAATDRNIAENQMDGEVADLEIAITAINSLLTE